MRLLVLSFILIMTVCVKGQTVRILIDPGHGGSDPGHESGNKEIKSEKDLTLIISKKFGSYLTSKLTNVEVLYTRTDDTYPSLDARVDLANSKKVDFFISIHINGSKNKSIHGTESHVHSLSAKNSVKLARTFEREFKSKAGRKSRGVKDTDDREHTLQVLKFTQMTSVLVECGFITNEKEAKYLNTEYGQDIIASALFRGMRTHLKETYPKINFESGSSKSNTSAKATNGENSFRIQIMSSKEWLDTEKGVFKKLSKPVTRKQVAQSGYKYVYFVGEFKSKSEAQAYLDEVKNQGFKDAIIVKK